MKKDSVLLLEPSPKHLEMLRRELMFGQAPKKLDWMKDNLVPAEDLSKVTHLIEIITDD